MTDEPLTPPQIEERMQRVGRRLWESTKEHRHVVDELAVAKADYNEKFHRAHVASMIDYPKRTGPGHKSYAELEAAGEYRRMVALEEVDKSLRSEQHSLRQLLSSLQSQYRHVGELAR